MLRLATGLASPAGERAKLSTFIFHQVHSAPDPLKPGEPDLAVFDQLLGWIGAQFQLLHPLEACERLFEGRLPARAAIITFDDGYQDNYLNALPLLKKHGASAAFFIATGYLGGGCMFNDRVIESIRRTTLRSLDLGFLGLPIQDIGSDGGKRQAIRAILETVKPMPLAARQGAVERIGEVCGVGAPTDLMMSPEQVRGLADAGMEIGGHTRLHPILKSLEPAQARAEIAGGRADLADLLGREPVLFAYPNGRFGSDFTDEHCRMVQDCGFRYSFSTERGMASRRANRFAIPRFTPWDRSRWKFQLRLLDQMRRSPG